MHEDLQSNGFALRPGAVGEPALVRLLSACSPACQAQRVQHPAGGTYGVRGLLWSSAALRQELDISGLSALAAAALGASAFPIEAIFFDKNLETNWSVPGHQDRLMPIKPGSSARSKCIRSDIEYAEPSETTLAMLVALRVHFDDIGLDDGALEVVPGSHLRGRLDTQALRAISLEDYRPCAASRGDVLMIRPLLLHRSRRKTTSGHRRVLHVVYASQQPDDGSLWNASA